MVEDLGFDGLDIGILDFAFLISYGLGLFISGRLGDRFSAVYVVTLGMMQAAVVLTLIGMLG